MQLPFRNAYLAWRAAAKQMARARQEEEQRRRTRYNDELDARIQKRMAQLTRHGFVILEGPSWPVTPDECPPYRMFYALRNDTLYKISIYHAGGTDIERV